MLTNLRKNFNFPSKKSIKSIMGFSVLEILIVLTIIAIMFGAMVAMKSPFQERLSLRNSALALQQDLRTAQSYAVSNKNNYYGVRFFNNLGIDMLQAGDLRDGWKILRYEGVTPPATFNVDAPPLPPTLMKSSQLVDSAELFDKTFFERGVSFSLNIPVSELRPSAAVPPRHTIVFDSRGSATSNGVNLLPVGVVGVGEDQIILAGFGHTITITITPLTGHIEVGDVQ
jgi:type II secretory pathway pseudopilin PulG